MTRQITIRFLIRMLTRFKHASKLGPRVLAYTLVKAYCGRTSQFEHLARFLLETAERIKSSRSADALSAGRRYLSQYGMRAIVRKTRRQRAYRGRRRVADRLYSRHRDYRAAAAASEAALEFPFNPCPVSVSPRVGRSCQYFARASAST
jgi:hypothetical protein